jgi:hypothetical protein
MSTTATWVDNQARNYFAEPEYLENLEGLQKNLIEVIGATIGQRSPQTLSYRIHGHDTLNWGGAENWIILRFVRGLVENRERLGLPEQADIWKSIQILKGLDEIGDTYSLSMAANIQMFLMAHPVIIDVLLAAYPYLINAFGYAPQIRLEVFRDPEAVQSEQLIAYIITNLPVDQALARLSEFDDRWFIQQLDQVGGDFNFNLEIV